MGDERPDGYSSTRNFHISNARVRTVEVELAISFFDAHASGPQLSDVRTVIFELRFLPYGASGRDTTSSGRLIDLPFLGTWKEIRN
jgi:hypothetical protein